MEVILLQKIQNLGQLGDVVEVKQGYARNFLIPQGKALRATETAKVEVEQRKVELVAKEQDILAKAQGRSSLLDGLLIEIPAKSSDEGKLFGSVTAADIADAVTDSGHELAKAEVLLPDGALKTTGDFELVISLHPEVKATINVKVVPSDIN